MKKIQTLIVNPKKIPWKKIRHGYYRKDIARDKSRNLTLSLLKISKQAKLIPHFHSNIEWIYIIDGNFSDEYSRATKGMIKINTKGSIHEGKTNGCVLLVVWDGKTIPVK